MLVPDPDISEPNQLGIKIRPLQSMFLDILAARRIFVDKVNDLVEEIILRDENPGWEDMPSRCLPGSERVETLSAKSAISSRFFC